MSASGADDGAVKPPFMLEGLCHSGDVRPGRSGGRGGDRRIADL